MPLEDAILMFLSKTGLSATIKEYEKPLKQLSTLKTTVQGLYSALTLADPKGEPKPEYSLAPVSERLSQLLGCDVR